MNYHVMEKKRTSPRNTQRVSLWRESLAFHRLGAIRVEPAVISEAEVMTGKGWNNPGIVPRLCPKQAL